MFLKRLLSSLMLISSFTSVSVGLAAEIEKLSIPVTEIFLPKGFDLNDNVEVVVAGYLPNLCYQNVTTKLNVDEVTKQIKVEVLADYRAALNSYCLELLVPFLEVVSVGRLNKGDYSVVVNEKHESETRAKSVLSIFEARSVSIDDYIYAKVDYIEVNPNVKTEVILVGRNPSECLVLDQVKITSNGQDTYAILPILKKISTDCPRKNVPFRYEVKLPTELSAESILLHVRSMEGKSINTVIGHTY